MGDRAPLATDIEEGERVERGNDDTADLRPVALLEDHQQPSEGNLPVLCEMQSVGNLARFHTIGVGIEAVVSDIMKVGIVSKKKSMEYDSKDELESHNHLQVASGVSREKIDCKIVIVACDSL